MNKADYKDLFTDEDAKKCFGLLEFKELDNLAKEVRKIASIYEELLPNFIKTYVDYTNEYDDDLDPIKRKELATQYQKKEEDLERRSLDFFQSESPNIKRAIKRAEEIGEWFSVIDICDSLTTFYNIQTYWEDSKETLEMGLKAAKKDNNQKYEAHIYNQIAHTSRLLGNAEEGINYGNISYSMFCLLKDEKGKAKSLYTLGYLYRSLGKWEKSIQAFEDCLSLFEQFQDFVDKAGALDGLGQVYTKQEKFYLAEKYLQESLRIKEEKIGDRFEISKTLNNLGKVYCKTDRLEMADNMFKKSLKIKQEIGDRQGQGVSFNELGEVHRLMKDFDKALEYYNKSLDIKKKVSTSDASQTSDLHGEGLTLMCIGLLYQDKQEKEKALINWRIALENLNDYSPEYKQVSEWIKSSEQ